MSKPFKRYLVTSALPYANGPVHIGHLAGVYIPSDIYTRYLRLKGYDVISVCGSDEHGVPITIKARKEGVTPQQIVDRYHNMIKKSFEGLGMSFRHLFADFVGDACQDRFGIFPQVVRRGEVHRADFDAVLRRGGTYFLADRYITGECPHCHAEGAYGDQCEKCGLYPLARRVDRSAQRRVGFRAREA